MQSSKREGLSTEDEDRRRSPRISCGGLAKIVSVPSEGLALPGRLVNLSLEGCGLEMEPWLANGTRAEILLRVNSSSFRVLCEVRAHLAPSHVGVEFLRMSGVAESILAELMRELARQRAESRAFRTLHRGQDSLSKSKRIVTLDRSLVTMGDQITLLPPDRQASGEMNLVKRSSIVLVSELDLFI